jgi:DUF1009 family protein
MRKLGLIAGGGRLPMEIADHCARTGRPVHILRLRGFAGPEMDGRPGETVGLAELGKCIRSLKRAGCEAVCLAGNVARPDFRKLKPDFRGLRAIPWAIAAARRGDDALLRYLVGIFEHEGFAVEGAHEVTSELTLPPGRLGAVAVRADHRVDIARALEVAREIGRLDIGQGAVVCDGLVLAVEAQEGTDAMLERVAGLPAALRGAPGRPKGVLVKAPKPIQEERVDLPTIGPSTIQGVARAGLAGVAGEAGRLLVLERDEVIRLADELGVFVLGLEPDGP